LRKMQTRQKANMPYIPNPVFKRFSNASVWSDSLWHGMPIA
jgi:hypothetical protein